MYEFYQKEYDETVEARKAQGQKEPNEEELSLLWNLEAYKKKVEEPSFLDSNLSVTLISNFIKSLFLHSLNPPIL